VTRRARRDLSPRTVIALAVVTIGSGFTAMTLAACAPDSRSWRAFGSWHVRIGLIFLAVCMILMFSIRPLLRGRRVRGWDR
jgi:hypothetical protein